ncbi:MAG: glycerophosphodiester phosphodiesterase family protein [Velocimicrobium sp.]
MLKIAIFVCIIVGILFLYLIAIMPRILNRPSYKVLYGYYYAHRGLYDNQKNAPENSMRAFELAIEKGYGIELDVQITKDFVPVVFHDTDLYRSCKIEGRLDDYTFEELMQVSLFKSNEKIPKFEQVLSFVDGRVPLIVEIKSEDSKKLGCQLVYELLKNYKGVYCVESFNPFVIHWFKKNASKVLRGQLSSNYAMAGDKHFLKKCVGYLVFNFLTKPDFIAYDRYYVNTLSRKICKSLYQCLSVAWTITSQEQLDDHKKAYDIFIFEGFEPKTLKE